MNLRPFATHLPRPSVLGGLFILVLSFFTIFYGYSTPQHFFWDENYHIASAQKYLNGIYFMEPHPPLGKMLVALGERILNRNALDDQFIGTDYAKDPPAGFSFTGYRFVPVLLAWLTAPLLFLCFLLLTRHPLWAVFLSFLFAFDNAMIVHLRGAMLEGPLVFFSVLTLLSFLLCFEWRDEPRRFRWAALLFGAAFACVMLTKVFGLILILLVPAVVLLLWKNHRRSITRFLLWSAIAFIPLSCAVWYLHFALATRINPSLPDQGYYQASETYKQILSAQKTASPIAFPVMLRDSLKFVGHYEHGVPRLNLCKLDENGSPFFLWPLGARTINYRWETPNGQAYRYLYLQANPVIWAIGLSGIVLSIALLLASWLAPLQEPLRHRPLLLTFLALYLGFMGAVALIDRVMYLYHYFIPLILSFFLFALCWMELQTVGKRLLTNESKTIGLLLLSLLVFIGYQFYRPLTYYEAITDAQFQRRAWLPLWELKCVRCAQESMFVIPTTDS